jgi:hypothetical protein
VIAVKGYKHLIDFETSSGNCTSRPREIVLVCLEMKMIGKPYAGELHVRFDEGEQDCFHGRFYTGTKLETAETAKSRPNQRRACSLLYPWDDPVGTPLVKPTSSRICH